MWAAHRWSRRGGGHVEPCVLPALVFSGGAARRVPLSCTRSLCHLLQGFQSTRTWMVQGHQLTLYLLGRCPAADPAWEMSVLPCTEEVPGQSRQHCWASARAGGRGLSAAPPDANWGCAHGMTHGQPDPVRRWACPLLAAQGGP